jgi:lysophospholipase L1-like esterase
MRALLLFVLYLVVPLVGVELGLRILRPAPLFERIVIDDPTPKPGELQYVLSPNRNLIYVPKPGSGEFNRDGYRGPLVPRERQPGRSRIVVLGDSVVEGWGVEVDQRFTSLLATRLGPGYEVVNLGVRGYGLLQELEYLKVKGLHYAPDHVLFGITYNDLWVRSAEWRALVRKFEKMEGSAFYRSYYDVRDGFHSRLLDLHLYRHLLFLLARPDPAAEPFGLEESEAQHSLDRAKVAELLAELAALAEAHDFDVAFFLLPVNADRHVLEVVGEAAREHDWPVLDLDAEATRQLGPEAKLDLFLPKDPCHLTPDGNAWTAERLAEHIERLAATGWRPPTVPVQRWRRPS